WAKKVLKFDLFPEISKEVALRDKGRSQKAHKHYEDSSNGHYKNSKPRAPTEDKNVEALKQIKDKFRFIDHGSVRLSNQRSNQIICVLEFLKIVNLDQKQREDLDFHCGFFHDCKPFISPDLSEISCNAITLAIGWSAENTRKHLKTLASCAFPSHNFHDNLDLEGDQDSENPLSFAMVIPAFKTAGRIALEAEGHRVDNGQFVLPHIKEAIVFAPDTICMMIFRAHEYAHGTLHATKVGDLHTSTNHSESAF
ncbi:hypothetical protein MJO29_014191, partial [Puccinia striiformis f. sp. tritici]